MSNIKVTNAFIEILGQGALQGFIRKEIPAKLSHHISRCIKRLQPELEALNETRQAIIKKYAELDDNGEIVTEDGRTIKWKEGHTQEDVMKEMDEILKDEVEIDIEKLGVDLDEVPLIALADMNILEEFIESI